MAIASLVGVPVGITSSAVELNIYAITTEIKKYKSSIKEKKMFDNTVLLAKTKLNTIKILISKVLINSCINNDEY